MNDLWLLVSGWKSFGIHYNEEPIDLNDFKGILRIYDCSLNYKKAVIQEIYCKASKDQKGWSCKHLNEINSDSSDSRYFFCGGDVYWYDFGEFVSEKVCGNTGSNLESRIWKFLYVASHQSFIQL